MEKELQSHKEKLSECTKQIESFESVVSDKIKNISYLENVIKMKDSEGRQANHVIEKIKSMNSENCQQLQLQIDSVSVRHLLPYNVANNCMFQVFACPGKIVIGGSYQVLYKEGSKERASYPHL